MAEFDLQATLDRQPIRPIHVAVIVTGTMLMFVDGFDVFMLGKIAPAVARSFGQRPSAMTAVFVSQQIGLAVGAFAVTPLADLFGRRRLLLISALVFGVLTLAAGFAPSLSAFAVLRGAAGPFLAGVVPMVMAFVTDLMPARRRGLSISIVLIGYSLGNLASGFTATWLLDRFGWQSGFWVGGAISLACLPLLFLVTPESPQSLASRDPADPRIMRSLRRIDPSLDPAGVPVLRMERSASGGGVRGLFDIWRGSLIGLTAVFWVATALSMGNVALMASWLSSFFLQMQHVPIQRFAGVLMIGQIGSLAGTLAIGALIDRIAPHRVIAVTFVILSAMIVMVGLVPFTSALFVPVMILWSLCQTGGQAGLNIFIARAYPARLRSTGLGWAGGAGRIFSIFTPMFGGYALAHNLSLPMTLAAPAAAALAIGGLMALAGGRAQPKLQAA